MQKQKNQQIVQEVENINQTIIGLNKEQPVNNTSIFQQQIQDKELNQNTQVINQDIVCVWGIQKFFDQKQCLRFFRKNFLEQNNFVVTQISKPRNKPFFYIKFESGKQKQRFLDYSSSNQKKIRVREVKHDITHQRFIDINQLTAKKQQKRQRKIPTQQKLKETIESKIQDIVEPYHNLPYQTQIQNKTAALQKIIQNYNIQFYKDNEVKAQFRNGKQYEDLKLTKFISCEQKRKQYRNKTQFTIGYTSNGTISVGFNKGSFQHSTIMIQDPRNVSIISKKTKMVAAVLQHYIKKKEIAPFDRFDQTGFWRYLVVRQSQRTKQILLMIVGATKNVSEQTLKELKQQLIDLLRKSIIGLVGLCFLGYNGASDSIPIQKPEVLWGNGFYHQNILGINFQVSSTAFLQGHTDMCQTLYSKIMDLVKQCEVVLDLCCGIGTIGICIKSKLKEVKVIGIQCCPQAVDDAHSNDPNYQVILAKVQDAIKQVTQRYRGRKIIGILDPPRAGVNKDVITALRRCRGLDNIIYVACNPSSVQDNLLQLTLPVNNKRKAPQFVIKQLYGFDLFPQTKHFEALYYLQRT